MSPTQNYLYYKTPSSEFQTHYPKFDLKNPPFTSKIYSQIPRITALIRAAFASLTASFILLKNTSFLALPLGIGCLAYSVWTLYKSFVKKDPLLEAYYKIAGSQEKYEKLPELKFTGKASASQELKNLDWDGLQYPLYKATAQNGNRILIVRALSRYPEQECSYSQVKTIYAFVERLEDENLFLNILQGLNVTQSENDTRVFSTHSSSSLGNYKTFINASIEPELANELAAQN
jgi:hypothetical protein